MKRIVFALFVSAFLFTGCGAQKQEVASVVENSGTVQGMIAPAQSFVDLKTGQKLCSGDSIKTGESSKANLELISDKSQIVLTENSFLEIKNFTEKELKQISGTAIYRITPQNRELKIQTQHGVATVLGTTLRVDTDEKETSVAVEKGKVSFQKKTSTEKVFIEAGMRYSTSFSENKAEKVDPIEQETLFNPGKNLKPVINPR